MMTGRIRSDAGPLSPVHCIARHGLHLCKKQKTMGRNSGGVNNYARATSGQSIAVGTSGKRLTANQATSIQASATSIDTLPDREVVKQLQRAISRYDAVMGIRERKIMVANLPNDEYGVTFVGSNGSHGIYLNRKFFSQSRNDIEAQYRKNNYETRFKNLTNRPIQHTMTHELAHASWTSSYTAAKQRAAGVQINNLFTEWKADRAKKDYGSYGRKNVDEFWAEAVTKAIHGQSDQYTQKIISIAKKYKL